MSLHIIMASLGFPLWLRLSHYINLLFIGLLIRSGIEILGAHPRLYWNDGCTPRTEWIKFTKKRVPTEKGVIYTARDDETAISSWLALPGHKNLGLGRHQFTYGGKPRQPFYEVIDMILARHAQTILAYELNDEPVSPPHGAPLRLRVETQLGYKMVKYLRSIELIADYRTVGEGQGGSREDTMFYGRGAEI